MSDITSSPSASRTISPARWSSGPGWRYAILGVLTTCMFVPLIAVSFVIEDRASYQRDAIREVSQLWGGPITLSGPMMVIPVERERTRTVKSEDGVSRTETYREQVAPIVLMPEDLSIVAGSTSEIRTRGIFNVPVFSADLEMSFSFRTDRTDDHLGESDTILWDRARLTLLMPRTRSFSGSAALKAGGRMLDLEPGTPGQGYSGIQARLGDPRQLGPMTLAMGVNGAQSLHFAPAGRQTSVQMTSDWLHPSFSGTFLPRERNVTDQGFTARWEIPHLARDTPQVSREITSLDGAFGVRFYNPVDFYQKVERAAKYGILFISLTFLTVLLSERLSGRPVHPVQFTLIGIAQCIFFLLLLSFAEQIGFIAAYAVASTATIGLIGFYGNRGLGLGRHTRVLIGALVALYGTLFMILRSTDYALLAGSVLAFVAVALVMILTRRDQWYPDMPAPGDPAK